MVKLPTVGDILRVKDDDEDEYLIKVVAVDADEGVWTCVVNKEPNAIMLVNCDENLNYRAITIPTFEVDEKDFS